MSNQTTAGGGEPDVPIPPPRHLFSTAMAAAIGGMVGAAAGVILVIWLIGCDCCDDKGDTRTGQLNTAIEAPFSDTEARLS